MKILPLHSIIFSSEKDFSLFPKHECLSEQLIKQNLIGDSSIEISSIIFDEMVRLVLLKLSLGERVVISNRINQDNKNTFKSFALDQGAFVFDLKNTDVVKPALRSPSVERIKDKWDGITAIGDVHGELKVLKEALFWAQSRNHFVLFLGDTIDYGKETLKVMQLVYKTVMEEKGAFIIGNHERKIARWLEQKEHGKPSVRLNDGNKVTTQALKQLTKEEKGQWMGQFKALLAHASLILQVRNVIFVHAAIHPSYWTNVPNEIEIEQFALYGESEHISGKFKRTYKWIDYIPKDKIVVIGHDKRHTYPVVKTGAKGGQIIFLDTGCGKGGTLSSADFKFDDNELRLECFKRY